MHYGIISGRVTLFPVPLNTEIRPVASEMPFGCRLSPTLFDSTTAVSIFPRSASGDETAFAARMTVEMCNSVGQMTRGVHAEVRFRHGPVDRSRYCGLDQEVLATQVNNTSAMGRGWHNFT
jgi:hypothetical protein